MNSAYRILSCLAIGGVLVWPAASRADADLPLPLHLTAWAVNMSNIGTGSNAIVNITIERWSTDEERQQLITAFLEKGPDKLLDTLQDLKRVGFIRLPTTLGYDLHFARETPLPEGGHRIVIATDRRISFAEARNRPRSIDYPFTLIEIRLKPDGTGEGKMSVATKISYNKKDKVIELENYASEPVRLTNVKIEK